MESLGSRLVLICMYDFAIHMYSKCACASLVGVKVVGPKPDQPNCLLWACTWASRSDNCMSSVLEVCRVLYLVN